MLYIMKFNLLLSVALVLLLSGCIKSDKFNITHDYPKSVSEKRDEQIGSIVGPKGLEFKLGLSANVNKSKNDTHQNGNKNINNDIKSIENNDKKTSEFVTKKQINKYVWQAAINVMSSMPLIVVDENLGLIVTDWYKTLPDSNVRYKFNVLIHDGNIKPGIISVKVFQDSGKSAIELKNQIEKQIIDEARSLTPSK